MTASEVCYLTTTGRRTGQPHRIEIWYVEHDGDVYLLSGGGDASDWVRNLRAEPQVLLELPGRPAEPWRASVVEGPAEEVRRAMDERYHRTRPEQPLTQWAATALVIRLRPDPDPLL